MNPKYKVIQQFSKKLTVNKLMQSDIITEFHDDQFKDKVALCFNTGCGKCSRRLIRTLRTGT